MFKPLLVFALSVSSLACIVSNDVRGDYNATMIRSSRGCANPTPVPKSVETTLEIANSPVGGETIAIHGIFACDASWVATDYGPIGNVEAVAPGCALQPAGTKFVGGDFAAHGFSMTWQATDDSSCTITDEWTMTKR